MKRQRSGRRPRWCLLLALAVTLALLGLGDAVTSAASPGSVAQVQCSAPAWDFAQRFSYQAGDVVSHNGREWRALFYTFGQEPGQGSLWQDLGPCAPPSTTTSTTSTTSTSTTSTTTPPAESVYDFYDGQGSWSVTSQTVDISGAGETLLHYPANLGGGGYLHPIAVFGNGSGGTCAVGTLELMASWGYMTACPTTGEVVPQHLTAAAQWAVDQNTNPSSSFNQKLDTDKVAAVGFSRGAATTVGAAAQQPDLFRTIVPISVINRSLWFDEAGAAQWVEDLQTLDDITVFWLAGTNERLFGFIQAVTQEEQEFFFDTTPGPAARAAAVGLNHELPPTDPRHPYLIAWLKYALEGDQFARGAFAGGSPEINTRPGWDWQEQKNLP